MDRQELETILQSRGVPQGMYRIGGDADEAYCLVPETNGWLVYYSERGNRNDPQRHASEHDACMDLMTRVLRQFERDAAW